MTSKFLYLIFLEILLLLNSVRGFAQDRRVQYPAILKNSFFGVSIGSINYPFSSEQLEPGYNVASIQVPHTAVRLILYGHEFSKYVSAQLTYMRPVDWIEYKNINGDKSKHTVWMNVAALTLTARTPSWKKISLYGEFGISIITRKGFYINNNPVVKNANYATVLAGAGLAYHLNDKWRLIFNVVYSPGHSKDKQPHTIFYSAGFNYTLRSPAESTVKQNSSKYIFPKDLLQFGYTTNALGYGVNKAVSEGPVPIFWGGDVKTRRGISIHYQHNIFHTRKVFSLAYGASFGWWQSRDERNPFYTISLYPLLRFTALRMRSEDIYFNYSVAGPSFISKTVIDKKNTGRHFTFQDFMGMGIYFGKKRNYNTEIRIAHYSNGNLFPENVGVMIPLSFYIGYTFLK